MSSPAFAAAMVAPRIRPRDIVTTLAVPGVRRSAIARSFSAQGNSRATTSPCFLRAAASESPRSESSRSGQGVGPRLRRHPQQGFADDSARAIVGGMREPEFAGAVADGADPAVRAPQPTVDHNVPTVARDACGIGSRGIAATGAVPSFRATATGNMTSARSTCSRRSCRTAAIPRSAIGSLKASVPTRHRSCGVLAIFCRPASGRPPFAYRWVISTAGCSGSSRPSSAPSRRNVKGWSRPAR